MDSPDLKLTPVEIVAKVKELPDVKSALEKYANYARAAPFLKKREGFEEKMNSETTDLVGTILVEAKHFELLEKVQQPSSGQAGSSAQPPPKPGPMTLRRAENLKPGLGADVAHKEFVSEFQKAASVFQAVPKESHVQVSMQMQILSQHVKFVRKMFEVKEPQQAMGGKSEEDNDTESEEEVPSPGDVKPSVKFADQSEEGHVPKKARHEVVPVEQEAPQPQAQPQPQQEAQHSGFVDLTEDD